MAKKPFTKSDAKAERARARKLLLSRAESLKKGKMMCRSLESKVLLDNADLKRLDKQLKKDEFSIARLLRPVSILGRRQGRRAKRLSK